MKTFKDRLYELRQERDLTKVDLAKRIGKSKSAITRYETGEIQPTLDVLLKLKQEFGVSLDWLAGYDEPNQKTKDVTFEQLNQIIQILNK
jgi:transcriptional regulator with XRE-family HTH domain